MYQIIHCFLNTRHCFFSFNESNGTSSFILKCQMFPPTLYFQLLNPLLLNQSKIIYYVKFQLKLCILLSNCFSFKFRSLKTCFINNKRVHIFFFCINKLFFVVISHNLRVALQYPPKYLHCSDMNC